MEWITQNTEWLSGIIGMAFYLALTIYVKASKKPDAHTGPFANFTKWLLRTLTPGKYTDENGNWSIPLVPPPKEP